MIDLNTTFAEISLWYSQHALQIAVAIGAGALIVLLLIGVKGLLLSAAARLGDATLIENRHSWPALFGSGIRRTRLWFMVALAARLVKGYANAPELVGQTISFVFVIAATFQMAIWVRTFVLGFVEHRADDGSADPHLTSAMAIIRLLVSFAIFAIATIFVLDNLGVNVTGLIAGLGVGGIAIGLAAQGIFGDLFAALSILFDKPFQVGDTIVYQGKEGPITGTVERIGLKSTRIRSTAGDLRILANAKLLDQELTNYTGRTYHRMALKIGVVYHTDLDVAEHLPALLQTAVEQAGQHFVRASFIGFGPSSLDYELLFDAQVHEIPAAKTAFQAVGMAILRTFVAQGIEFAYPTQTSFTAAPDGTLILPYPEGSSSDASP